MPIPIERITLSQQARDQLVTLKRRTGIKNWNVLCRWAFCTSLAEASIPPKAEIPADSSLEMSWRVFGGEYQYVYLALLRERCKLDGLGGRNAVLVRQFRLHLHRGISYLAADKQMNGIAELIRCTFPGDSKKK